MTVIRAISGVNPVNSAFVNPLKFVKKEKKKNFKDLHFKILFAGLPRNIARSV